MLERDNISKWQVKSGEDVFKLQEALEAEFCHHYAAKVPFVLGSVGAKIQRVIIANDI